MPRSAYLVIASDCEETSRRAVLESIGGSEMLRFHPEEIVHRQAGIDYDALMSEPGDGRVYRTVLLSRFQSEEGGPKAALPIGGGLMFICAPHSELPASLEARHNLLSMLLY
jgi:hypothetical protein